MKNSDNFGAIMDLMGQIQALLKVEMHIMAERQMLEAELAKLREAPEVSDV